MRLWFTARKTKKDISIKLYGEAIDTGVLIPARSKNGLIEKKESHVPALVAFEGAGRMQFNIFLSRIFQSREPLAREVRLTIAENECPGA